MNLHTNFKKAKITTVGNSAGITLPKEVLDKLRVAKGDYLIIPLMAQEKFCYSISKSILP